MPRQSFKLEAEVPAELIQNIFKFSDLPSLVNLMTTSKWISDIARTTLYQSIDLDLDRARLASCMKALLNSDVSELVHRLRVDFDRRDPGGPHPILFSDKEGVELIRCLKRLPNLQRLTLNMTLFDTAKPLNDVFPFKLIEFSTTLACGGDLLSFVERQSTLQELGIDSVIEDPGLLDGVRLPEIRVLRWGHEPDPKPAAFELIKRIPTVQDIHVIFSEPGIMEATMDTLKLWKTRAKPTRAFVTILFNSCAMSLVSAGIEGLNHISLIESVDDLGCFNNVRVSFQYSPGLE